MNLVTGWNNFLSFIPGWLLGTFGVAGVVIIVFVFGKWLWDRRSQGGAGGYPWKSTLVGGIMAAPSVLVPAVLLIIGLGFELIVNLLGRIPGLG